MSKRRPYLLSFALAFAALVPLESKPATVTNSPELVGSDTQALLVANPNPFEFVIEKSDESSIIAAHRSHRSHSSHRSHRSHYSGR